MASHHLLTSRWPRSDLLVDRDGAPVEFDRHNAQNVFGPAPTQIEAREWRRRLRQRRRLAPQTRGRIPPDARSGRSLGMGWLQPRPHQSFGGFGFSLSWNCRFSSWAGARFRLGGLTA